MSREKHYRIATAALVGCAVVLTWAFVRTPQPAPNAFTAAGKSMASPVIDPTQEAFRATMLARTLPEETAAATATVPPQPTPTPRPVCEIDNVPTGGVCFAATLELTPPPANVLPTSTPFPPWPGTARATPGRAYAMPMPTPPAMYWNLP